MPRFSDDDVVDFMVMEAMTTKLAKMREKEQDRAKRQQFRESHRNLRGMKGGQAAPPIPGGMG